MSTVLDNKLINGWGLFSLISIPLSLWVIYEMTTVDLSQGAGISEMIGFSVRIAVPFIYFAMAASSINILLPGTAGRWWLRNRRYIGLCFAVGMAWQGLFIFIISTFFRNYYYSEVYYFRDELEGTFGYIFLAAMIVTSFQFARKRLDLAQWKLIQKGGIYVLWGYAFSVYWWNLYYYGGYELHDIIYYWGGFLAFALRIAAWGKQRQILAVRQGAAAKAGLGQRAAGIALIMMGLVVSATGGYWQEAMTSFMTTPGWSAQMELWLPFWPLEPYYSLILMALGTAIITWRPNPAGAATAPA